MADLAEGAEVSEEEAQAEAGNMIPHKKYLSKQDLKVLSEEIQKAERNTSGEIRVVFRHFRHWNERKLSLHDLSLGEFYRLGMDKTRNRTGVLILVLFSERKFQIIADEGIHAKVEEGTWDTLAGTMSGYFKDRHYREGITETVKSVGDILSTHFPRRDDDRNELSNDVIES